WVSAATWLGIIKLLNGCATSFVVIRNLYIWSELKKGVKQMERIGYRILLVFSLISYVFQIEL
ncbi:MAG: hypothetical protein P8X73_16865, partial [Ignavibacteriaceae bacterium]